MHPSLASEKTFESFFKAHYAVLVRYALGYLGDQDDAENAVQEVLVKLWEKRANTEETGDLKALAYRMVANHCINALKHHQVIQLHAVEIQHTSTERAEEGIWAEHRELEVKIDQAIQQLPPERKRIFMMSRFENLKYQDIATSLGISVKTVENQMGKALNFLRNELKEYLNTGVILLVLRWIELFFNG